MWRRASGLRRGFTSQFDSAFISDDMVAAPGTSSSSCAAAAGRDGPSPPRAFGAEEEEERWWACVGPWTRSRAGGFGD